MNNLNITRKLLIFSLLAVAALVAVGIYGIYNLTSSFTWVEQVYMTASSINEANTKIGEPLNNLRQMSLSMVMAPDKKMYSEFNQKRLSLVEQINKSIPAWKDSLSQHLGQAEMEDFKNFQTLWEDYKQLSNTTSESIAKGYRESAFLNVIGAEHKQFEKVFQNFLNFSSQMIAEAKKVYASAEKNYERTLFVFMIVMIVFAIFVFIVSTLLARRISKPLIMASEQLKSLALGHLKEEEIAYQGKDEIGGILVSLRQLKRAISSTISQARAIAAGDYSNEVQLLSADDQLGLALTEMIQTLRSVIIQANAVAQGDYSREFKILSEDDRLGQALTNMTHTLRDVTSRNQREDWLKSGQAQVGERLSGDQGIAQLAQNIVNFITPYVDAQVGALFVAETDIESGETTSLRLLASHAYTWRKGSTNVIRLGEGLVGQAALEHKAFVVADLPHDYLQIQSGLGGAVPRMVLVAPFLYENELKGVIELASFQSFTEIHLELIKQIMPMVGIAVNTAESRSRMQILLKQTQTQSEELKTRAQELEFQKAEVMESNEKLKNQAEELQSQAEELQAQQEELRQTNELLEDRTHSLEKQQKNLNDKNLELEKIRVAVEAKAEELAIASKYKSEFLANMSHELRTPLNSLLILSQMLHQNKDGNLSTKQMEYARTIHSAGSDLLNLINDILDLSKIEAGKIQLNLEAMKISDFVESLQGKFNPIAGQRKVEFVVKIAPNVPESLHTDAQRLKQVLINLLSNAFKFTEQGQVIIDISRPLPSAIFHNKKLTHSNAIALAVIDSGIGIPKEKQQLIFEAFQQADGTTSRRYGGTGLGLSISRQLAGLLGGEIHVQSEENKGSRFTLFIPDHLRKDDIMADNQEALEAAETAPRPARHVERTESPLAEARPAPTQPKSAAPLADDRAECRTGDKSLLIIEDDQDFAKVLMQLAKEKGFKCLYAEDGKTGLQVAQQYKPAAIMLDIGLPQVDGLTVMEVLKDSPETRHIPVHFVSGTEASVNVRRMGAIGHSLKPVSLGELTDVFQRLDNFVSKTVKHLLVLTDRPEHQNTILETVSADKVQTKVVTDWKQAQANLNTGMFDCFVLDAGLQQSNGINLLKQFSQESSFSQIPVIVYAPDALSEAEEQLLRNYQDVMVVKPVRSDSRLLDEATLFLHQVESSLQPHQQKMLQMVHDKESVFKNRKVLLVDDDPRNVFALASALEEKEMEVITANNGIKALKVLEENPDTAIVLMDIMMPEMDGYEATRRIRAHKKFHRIPVIALTAKAMKGDKAKCIEAGASDYLAKPIEPARLLSLIRVWLCQ